MWHKGQQSAICSSMLRSRKMSMSERNKGRDLSSQSQVESPHLWNHSYGWCPFFVLSRTKLFLVQSSEVKVCNTEQAEKIQTKQKRSNSSQFFFIHIAFFAFLNRNKHIFSAYAQTLVISPLKLKGKKDLIFVVSSYCLRCSFVHTYTRMIFNKNHFMCFTLPCLSSIHNKFD